MIVPPEATRLSQLARHVTALRSSSSTSPSTCLAWACDWAWQGYIGGHKSNITTATPHLSIFAGYRYRLAVESVNTILAQQQRFPAHGLKIPKQIAKVGTTIDIHLRKRRGPASLESLR
jgi:hypothetical protein